MPTHEYIIMYRHGDDLGVNADLLLHYQLKVAYVSVDFNITCRPFLSASLKSAPLTKLFDLVIIKHLFSKENEN